MSDAPQNDWERRYQASIDAVSESSAMVKFGPLPENEPGWFSRRSWVPFALRRDHIIVVGPGDRSAVVGRIDRVSEHFRFHQWVRLVGFRLVVRPRVGSRDYDFHYPIFVGKVVSGAGSVRIQGVIRPTRLAWAPLVVLAVTLFGVESGGVLGAWLPLVAAPAVFAMFWAGLLFGRGRDRRRRAQIVMVLEQLGDGDAVLRHRPHPFPEHR